MFKTLDQAFLRTDLDKADDEVNDWVKKGYKILETTTKFIGYEVPNSYGMVDSTGWVVRLVTMSLDN